MSVITYAEAIRQAMSEEMRRDENVIFMGEDIGTYCGAFGVSKGMLEEFGESRVIDTPISETAYVGAGIGAAVTGMRPIVELMFSDFVAVCYDQLINQAAKMHFMFAGKVSVPMVIRTAAGGGTGAAAQHSQSLEQAYCNIPGLKVVFPVTPYDAKGLMNSALQGTDPVIFFESQRLYGIGEQFHEGGVPEGYYEIPIGEPYVKRVGKDVTFLTIGATLYRALKAADMLKEKYGLEAEVIDARSLVPFDYGKVIESVKKTGRIIIAGDASARGSFLNDLAANIADLCFDYLDAAPAVLGSRNWITPCHELEEAFFPQPEWFLDIINEKMVPLPGYVPTGNFTAAQQIIRAKKGV